jgi:hypothetical protein
MQVLRAGLLRRADDAKLEFNAVLPVRALAATGAAGPANQTYGKKAVKEAQHGSSENGQIRHNHSPQPGVNDLLCRHRGL